MNRDPLAQDDRDPSGGSSPSEFANLDAGAAARAASDPSTAVDPSIASFLKKASTQRKENFLATGHPITFTQYLGLFRELGPSVLVRHGAQLLQDALVHYDGANEPQFIRINGRNVRRFAAMDSPWLAPNDPSRVNLEGFEPAIEQAYSFLERSKRSDRPRHLLVFRGPEVHSAEPLVRDWIPQLLTDFTTHHKEGAVFTFRFVLSQSLSNAMGFIGGTLPSATKEGDLVYVEPSSLTPPYYLLRRGRPHSNAEGSEEKRGADIRESWKNLLEEQGLIDANFNRGLFLRRFLDPLTLRVLGALESHYKGEYDKVLEHVQVLRVGFRHNFGEGVATVPDASDLPGELAPLYSGKFQVPHFAPDILSPVEEQLVRTRIATSGATVGVVIWPDLIKATPDGSADSTALEKVGRIVRNGAVIIKPPSRPPEILSLAAQHIGVCTDNLLALAQRDPDFYSRKAVMRTVAVPNITRVMSEVDQYESRLKQELPDEQMPARHTLFAAALINTSTRLLLPNPDHSAYKSIGDGKLPDLLRRLKPVQITLLFDPRVPVDYLNLLQDEGDKFSSDEIGLLQTAAPLLANEHAPMGTLDARFTSLYHGGIGISLYTALDRILDAAQDEAKLSVASIIQRHRQLAAIGHHYYEVEITQAIEAFRLQRIAALEENERKKNEQKAAGGDEVADANPSAESLTAEQIRMKVEDEIRVRFPVARPADIINQVEELIRGLVRLDVLEALRQQAGSDPENILSQYIEFAQEWGTGVENAELEAALVPVEERSFRDLEIFGERWNFDSPNQRAAFRRRVIHELGSKAQAQITPSTSPTTAREVLVAAIARAESPEGRLETFEQIVGTYQGDHAALAMDRENPAHRWRVVELESTGQALVNMGYDGNRLFADLALAFQGQRVQQTSATRSAGITG